MLGIQKNPLARCAIALLLLASFFMQTAICHADAAGLMECEHVDDCAPSREQSQDETSDAPLHVCHQAGCHSATPIFLSVTVVQPAGAGAPVRFFVRQCLPPDDPVFAVDHPPQIRA